MPRICYVTVSIRQMGNKCERVFELGEFQEVWRHAVSIGRDPGCSIVLNSDDVAPVAARVEALSNHILLYRLPTDTTLPLPPIGNSLQSSGERVDGRPFKVGDFVVQLGEVSRDTNVPDLRVPVRDSTA